MQDTHSYQKSISHHNRNQQTKQNVVFASLISHSFNLWIWERTKEVGLLSAHVFFQTVLRKGLRSWDVGAKMHLQGREKLFLVSFQHVFGLLLWKSFGFRNGKSVKRSWSFLTPGFRLLIRHCLVSFDIDIKLSEAGKVVGKCSTFRERFSHSS